MLLKLFKIALESGKATVCQCNLLNYISMKFSAALSFSEKSLALNYKAYICAVDKQTSIVLARISLLIHRQTKNKFACKNTQ